MWTKALVVVLLALTACADQPTQETSGDPPAVVEGTVVAGPTCPVVSDPPDPECADRPVEGAVIVALASDGVEVARAISDGEGKFTVELGPGETYTLVPEPVEGLMGTAEPVEVTLMDFGQRVAVTIVYDTGIR